MPNREHSNGLIRAAEALDTNILPGSDYHSSFSSPLQVELDQACLRFCTTLLDRRLLGPIYDSVIVGFLAVQGIDVKKNRSARLRAIRPIYRL